MRTGREPGDRRRWSLISAAAQPSSSSATVPTSASTRRFRSGPCATPSATCPRSAGASELEALADDVRSLIAESLEGGALASAKIGIGVAGTPTSLAAIDQRLDPYDPEMVHGYTLSLESIQRMFSELAAMPLSDRLEVPGLHAGRAPTIVAGVVILIQVMRAFGLSEIEVSEHDILWGAALRGRLSTQNASAVGAADLADPYQRAVRRLRQEVLVEDAEAALAAAELRVLDEAVDDRELDPADMAEEVVEVGQRLRLLIFG